MILDETVLTEGFAKYQEKQGRANAPMLERLKVIDDLLAENRVQMERLLDLYLTGEFARTR